MYLLKCDIQGFENIRILYLWTFYLKKKQVPIHLTFYTFKKSCSGKGFIDPSGKHK